MRATSNPAFRNLPRNGYGNYAGFNNTQTMQGGPQYGGYPADAADRPMTIDDVVLKTGITLAVTVAAAVLTVLFNADILAIPALIVGLVVSMIIIFRRRPSAVLTLIYAAAEGIVLGAITHVFQSVYPGIAFQAILGTFGVFAAMLVVYRIGAVRVTPRLTRWVIGATVGVVVVMLADLVANLFGADLGIRTGGPLSIVFSIIVIGIAAFNLLLDFDQADRMIRGGYPSRWAWYAAFGLLVTLVWLYLEILRLLSYVQRGN